MCKYSTTSETGLLLWKGAFSTEWELFCPYLFISQGYKPGRKYSAPKTKVGCVGSCLALETGSPHQGSPPSHRSSSDHLGPQRKYIHRHDFQFLVSENVAIKMIFNSISQEMYTLGWFSILFLRIFAHLNVAQSQKIYRSRRFSILFLRIISTKMIFNLIFQKIHPSEWFSISFVTFHINIVTSRLFLSERVCWSKLYGPDAKTMIMARLGPVK